MLQLPIHRDTWGSGVQQQLNWWLPIYPVQEGRTLQLFPAHFAVPVENTSATWNVKEFVKWRDAAAARHVEDAAGGAPTDPAQEPVPYPSLPCAGPAAVEAILGDE